MIYAVTNQKGGTGKSTIAGALWTGLAGKGFNVLAIDLDAQGNLTYSANASTDRGQLTALSILTREATAAEAIQHTETGDIIAANGELAGADAFITSTGKEYRLKEALEEIKASYDYIIIDTPPALGILTINALTACDQVLIPAQADIYSLQGIEQLIQTIQPVKQYCNANLKIAGIILNRYNPRTVITRDITEYLKGIAKKLDTKVFDSKIREAITVKEAQFKQQSIFKYAPCANVTFDFLNLISEITEAEKHERQKKDIEALSDLCLKNEFYDVMTNKFKIGAFIAKARKIGFIDDSILAFLIKRYKLTEQQARQELKSANN